MGKKPTLEDLAKHDSEKKPKTMAYKTVKFSVFTDAMARLGITNPGDLSTALGYSRSAHNPWRKSKRLPKPAALACECLLRRQNKENDLPEPKVLFFLGVPKQHVLALTSFCSAIGIKGNKITDLTAV